MRPPERVERWDVFELDVTGTDATELTVEQDGRRFVAEVFTRGDRRLARFSPDREGSWQWRTEGTDTDTGRFVCTPAQRGNHGPVIIVGESRLGFSDGTPVGPIGTNATGWHRVDRSEVDRTLDAIAGARFAKVRMQVRGDGTEVDQHQLDRLEQAIIALRERGIGAELILFDAGDPLLADPDRWQRYLRLIVARFAAFRNVSWCLAVDADLGVVPDRTWDEVLRVLAESDHGHRLRTVGAGEGFDFGHRLISHCSVRTEQPRVCSVLVPRYRKPVVLDDLGAEGDSSRPRQSRTAEDLVADCWEAVCRGGYATHAEFFSGRWSQRGGALEGAAAPRLAFLREMLDPAPAGLGYAAAAYDASTLEAPGEFYLQYLGAHRFRTRRFRLPDDAHFRVEVLDTWTCRIEQVASGVSGDYELQLPDRLYNAVRILRC